MSRRTLPSRATPVGRNLFQTNGSGRLVAVAFPGLDEGPDGPCHAGGKGDGHQLDRFTLQHLPQPIFPCGPVAARGDLGRHAEGVLPARCAKIEQPSQIAVAHLGYFPQLFFATAGMGLWRQSYRHAEGVLSARRRKVSRRFEVRHIGDTGGKGTGGDRAYTGAIAGKTIPRIVFWPGSYLQALGHRVVLRVGFDLGRDLCDSGVAHRA